VEGARDVASSLSMKPLKPPAPAPAPCVTGKVWSLPAPKCALNSGHLIFSPSSKSSWRLRVEFDEADEGCAAHGEGAAAADANVIISSGGVGVTLDVGGGRDGEQAQEMRAGV
jgi:hypothetical protein